MIVTVQYYAMLREVTGIGKEEFELVEGSTGSALLERVIERHPGIQPYVPVIRLATETEYVHTNVEMKPGLMIALIPPVSGG